MSMAWKVALVIALGTFYAEFKVALPRLRAAGCRGALVANLIVSGWSISPSYIVVS